jgi:hypothetical protein
MEYPQSQMIVLRDQSGTGRSCDVADFGSGFGGAQAVGGLREDKLLRLDRFFIPRSAEEG